MLNYHSKETEKVIELFQQLQQHDITIAENLKDAAEKGTEDYDLIITGYVVPAVSGDKTLSYLGDIDKSIKEFETSLKGKKIPALIEKESLEKKVQIIQILNDQIRDFETEKVKIYEKLKNMEKATEAAQKAGEDAGKKADAAVKNAVEDKEEIKAKLQQTETGLQQSEIEKNKIQRKLEKLQEAWENYVG